MLLDGQTADVVLCRLEHVQLNGLKYLKEIESCYWKSRLAVSIVQTRLLQVSIKRCIWTAESLYRRWRLELGSF